VSGNSVHIRSRAFATFSKIEKAPAGRKKSFRGPCVVQAWGKLKRFVSIHLHCIIRNLKRVGQMSTLPPPGKISADAHGCSHISQASCHYILQGWVIAYSKNWFSYQVELLCLVSFMILHHVPKVFVRMLFKLIVTSNKNFRDAEWILGVAYHTLWNFTCKVNFV